MKTMVAATRTFTESYPQQVLHRREQRLRTFWAGGGPRAVSSVHDGRAAYRQINDDEVIVTHAVQQILDSAAIDSDYLPWFGPDFGTVSTALAWGGEVVHPEGGCPFIQPVIHAPEEADEIIPADAAGGHVARAIALASRVKDRLETDRIWCRMVDFQGPLSTAGLIWEQEDLFCSMYTDPDVVHRFLSRVTDHLIAMGRAMQTGMGPLCGMNWPYIWLPDDLGIVFTEDLMPLMPPDLYREFGIPYMRRLTEAFGGAFIHCCGAFEQHLPALAESGAPILGFDYAEPATRTEALYDAFGTTCAYHPMLAPGASQRWEDDAAFIAYLARVAPDDMRFFFTTDTTWPGAAARVEAIERLFL